MHAKQGWTETLEDGSVREVRAFKHAGNWSLKSRVKGEPEWTRHNPPLKEDLQSLRDLLYRKYMRRRCSIKAVEDVDQLLKKTP